MEKLNSPTCFSALKTREFSSLPWLGSLRGDKSSYHGRRPPAVRVEDRGRVRIARSFSWAASGWGPTQGLTRFLPHAPHQSERVLPWECGAALPGRYFLLDGVLAEPVREIQLFARHPQVPAVARRPAPPAFRQLGRASCKIFLSFARSCFPFRHPVHCLAVGVETAVETRMKSAKMR